jgi:ADP-ribose pyrophosphatase YjhB (NUDIX family)
VQGQSTTSYYAEDPTALRLSVSAVVRKEPGAREILLMRRSDNGLWGLPGGYVELGESVADATRREVEEETGFRVEVGRLIGVYSDPARQVIAYSNGDREADRVQAVNLCFEARALSKGEITTPEETLEAGFFPQDALPEPLVPIHDVRIADALAGEAAAAVR